jgi:hypothetical protein
MSIRVAQSGQQRILIAGEQVIKAPQTAERK